MLQLPKITARFCLQGLHLVVDADNADDFKLSQYRQNPSQLYSAKTLQLTSLRDDWILVVLDLARLAASGLNGFNDLH